MFKKKIKSFLANSKLPSQEQITFFFDKNKPKVSIICICYNHVNYIEDAIKGFLIQQSNYSFEIIIHDDASDDGSNYIIVDYHKKFPNLIKPILQKKNIYIEDKQGPLKNSLDRADGEYIALCEGDDFWFDSSKLQKQMDNLTTNPSFAMIVTAGVAGRENITKTKLHCYHGNNIIQFDSQDPILKKSSQFAPTASYLFKKSVSDFIYHNNYSKISVTDLFIELNAIRLGGIIYIPYVMSYYRFLTNGSWSKKMTTGGSKSLIKYSEELFHLVDNDQYLRELNWSYKRSYIFFGIAIAFLKEGNINKFKEYTLKSKNENTIPNYKLKVFYFLSRWPIIVKYSLFFYEKLIK